MACDPVSFQASCSRCRKDAGSAPGAGKKKKRAGERPPLRGTFYRSLRISTSGTIRGPPRGPSEALPVYPLRVVPKLLESVVLPGLGRKHVDDNVAVVLDDPLAGLVALDGKALLALRMECGVDLLGERVDLAAAGPGGNYEEVVERCLSPHVEDEHVAGLVLGRDPGTQTGVVQGDPGG